MTPLFADGQVAETDTALHVPCFSLCSCIRAYITRSTMDVSPLSEMQRHNHFPASSICVVTWYLQGESILVRLGDKNINIPLPSSVVFSGPRTEPSVSYNPGKVDLFMLVLLPEALHALTGLDIAAHTDQSFAFDQVFGPEWQMMAREVYMASDTARRIDLIEAFFEPLWIATRPLSGARANWLHDYMSGITVRIAASKSILSVRQLERRIKNWTGMSLQRLHKMRRAEHRYLAAREAMRSSEVSWADVAAENGYADQAHFCRETRKITGLTPKELKRRVMHEESYWVYRIWS